MRISDWSSDVCSSDLSIAKARPVLPPIALVRALQSASASARGCAPGPFHPPSPAQPARNARAATDNTAYRTIDPLLRSAKANGRSEEHTSELQSLMRISYAVFCLKKKNTHSTKQQTITYQDEDMTIDNRHHRR